MARRSAMASSRAAAAFPKARVPRAPRPDAIRSASSYRATVSSARTASSPATPAASTRSARCSRLKRASASGSDGRRVEALDWDALAASLDADGCARIEALLSPAECREIAALYPDEAIFRSKVVMARHGFGRGEYQYFAYPLPDPIAALRTEMYPR